MDERFLSAIPLFSGCAPEEIGEMLRCLSASRCAYGRGETILQAGQEAEAMGIVLSGCVQLELDDVWGRRSIIGQAGPGDVFAETYACAPGARLMVSAVAAQKSEILFLNASRLLRTCPTACPFHARLIQNLLAVTAQKSLALSRRILHTSQRSIREKLLSYLSYEAKLQGMRDFCIPFNRQQLADYLSVDRSALSAEMSRMKRDGLIDYEHSRFILRTQA